MDAATEGDEKSRKNEQCKDSGKIWGAKRAFMVGILLFPMAGIALEVDGPLARWLQHQKTGISPDVATQQKGASSAQPSESPRSKIPGDLKRLLTWSEGFGHAVGVLLVGLLIYQLDPSNRRRLGRALGMALGSGLVADGMKLLVGRTRPRAFDLGQPIWESFTGLLPGLAGGSAGQSFPSGHTATAVGWALGLAWLYPRGRWTFVFLAFLVLCQRVEANAHFLSDVLAGAAVGCLVSSLFLPGGWLSGAFDRWETSAMPSPRAERGPQQQKE